ncbi:MAG: selenide, water dikinase SelD [Brachymonas sp.]|nr:selenide, water dikinase SelD [Brachymonas sp.]
MLQETPDSLIRLTTLAHGGGCGCKIAPGVLQAIMAQVPQGVLPPQLLVGTESSDDAAVYQINATQALVATTDFFTPIVDDAHDFGRIAATNALSDVYAMGAQPLLALAVVGMPLDKLPQTQIARILQGGASVCAEAGIPLAGGHSIDVAEPIYGLVAVGLVDPHQLKKNSSAQAGDVLVLGKPLGVGVLSAALKKGVLSQAGYAEMLRATTTLNRAGTALAQLPGVHAMTDVTGFGLAGHLLEMCRGSQLAAHVEFGRLPLLAEAVQHVQAGIATGASTRNWASYGREVQLPTDMPEWQQKLLTDPQTSGGLLVACAADAVPQVLDAFRQHGCAQAAVIGEMREGDVKLHVAA